MSQPQLEQKIGLLLAKGIETEAEVVYFLVETRKLMERASYKDDYLLLFCNWVVHIELDRKNSGAQAMLKEFDDAIEAELNRQPRPKSSHYTFAHFKKVLLTYLRHFGFPDMLISDDSRWTRFKELYTQVVNECPILLTASGHQLKHIDSINLRQQTRGYMEVNGIRLPSITWEVKLKTGKSRFFVVNLETLILTLKRSS